MAFVIGVPRGCAAAEFRYCNAIDRLNLKLHMKGRSVWARTKN